MHTEWLFIERRWLYGYFDGRAAQKKFFEGGFVGAGGGMVMLLILTSVLGYELKTAVGTSVFIMAFTAFTGVAIGGMPDVWCLLFCIASTLLWARIAAKFANKASAVTLNRATGVVLAVLGAAILTVNYLG